MKVEHLAMICHEASAAYCQSLGDFSVRHWYESPMWQQKSVIDGVTFHIQNPDAGPNASHDNWLKFKEDDGWVYGPKKDEAKREHPCMVPYRELPEEQKAKDELFISIVDVFRDKVEL